jgi:hypothetical protein
MTGRGRFIVGWLLALLGGTLMLGGLWSGTVRADSRNAVVISLDTPIGPGAPAMSCGVCATVWRLHL